MSDFRNTIVNFGTISRRKELEQTNHLKIKAVALAHYVFEKIRLLDGLTN